MLLLDHNLSWRLIDRLADVFPESVAVSQVELAHASDEDVWSFVKERDLVIVAKDSDFNDLAVLRGPPPHLVWVRRGNCSTNEIEQLLRENTETIQALMGSQTAVLILT